MDTSDRTQSLDLVGYIKNNDSSLVVSPVRDRAVERFCIAHPPNRKVYTRRQQQSQATVIPSEHGRHHPDPANVRAATKWLPLFDKTA